MLRGANAEFWSDTLDLLRRANLSAIEDQLPEGQQSFFKAVEVSFQSLKPEMQERYKALAVLLEDMVAPLPILQTLWNVSEAETRLSSRQIMDRSLAQADGAGDSIRLHDLQLDYVRAQYPGKEALELIHGALRLSSNMIATDPGQFASQMVGRLLPYSAMPTIGEFTKRVAEGTRTPWLRALQPTLHPPGTALVRTLQGHSEPVNGVALSADGRLAVSASWDRTLKVWELASGALLTTFICDAGAYCCAFSHDRKLIVAGDGLGQVHFLRLEEPKSNLGEDLTNRVGYLENESVEGTGSVVRFTHRTSEHPEPPTRWQRIMQAFRLKR
jgi:WD40 repeat protein